MPEQPVMLVTGSRKGIGRYLSEYYGDRGFRVIGCSRGESDLVSPAYQHRRLDVANELEVKNLLTEIRHSHGRLDVLINNAGVGSMNHSLLMPLDTVKRILLPAHGRERRAIHADDGDFAE